VNAFLAVEWWRPMSVSQSLLEPPAHRKPLFLGVDVGGTSIKLGVVDDAGQTLIHTAIATQEPRGPEDAMRRVAEETQRLMGRLGLSPDLLVQAGLGTPGSMDLEGGMIVEPPNHPHWRNFPIRDTLARFLELPVTYINDANAAAFGEYWVGVGRRYRSMIMLTLGTGVGGGIIVDGHLVNGANSFGSECGHLIVDSRPDARLCVWGGGRGHLEAYASASGIVARAQELLEREPASRLAVHGESLTAKQIYLAATQGDTLARRLITETADYLAIGITSLVHCIDPGLVVLGGAMNFGGAADPVGGEFLSRVIHTFHELSFPHVAERTRIEFASLGGDAGYLGAAGSARVDFYRRRGQPLPDLAAAPS
jgi:glucokinase